MKFVKDKVCSTCEKGSIQDIYLSSKCITELMNKFSFTDCKPTKTAMSYMLLYPLIHLALTLMRKMYRWMIGYLLYLTTNHSDIMITTILCALYQANHKESHLHIVKRIFHYLKHTTNLRLWYPHDSEFKLVGYTDSDYGGYRINRKSTSGGTQLSGKQSYKLVKQKADVSGLLYC